MTDAVVDQWGIQQDWVDADDRPHRVDDRVVERLRALVGRPPEDLEDTAPVVTRPGRPLPFAGPVEVTCEDGTRRTVDGLLPDDFPLGYHRVVDPAGRSRALIVSPGRCHVPEARTWGVTVQLYAARSALSWGIGDLGDLRTLRAWVEGLGGGFVLVNPLHAVAPTVPQETSPYLPATRRFRNPVYLRVEEVPGVDDGALAEVEEELAELRAAPLVERDAAWRLKRAVLRRTFDAGGGTDPEFLAWREVVGPPVEEWGVWCVLAEDHGPDWRSWPAALRTPGSSAVAGVASDRESEVSFHVWLQWLVGRQLREAAGDLVVLQDLPIGVAGGGADAWAWQEVLASGATVGAPPDLLNTIGQDWGSPPLVPWKLRALDYEPFIESVRATIAGAGGLRIDHVMGLFRLWCIPEGSRPTDGAYLRYPAEDLLDIVALESHRARAVVVGEDLGTVEPGVREALEERGILSYRVLWFEDEPPSEWPEQALAAVTTHDLPTVAGLWSGSDVDDQVASSDMARADVEEGRVELLGRLRRGGLPAEASAPEAVGWAYRQLADAPSLLLSVALEDVVAEERRPNVPGTVDRDNWRIPLPVPVDQLVAGAVPAPVQELRSSVSR